LGKDLHNDNFEDFIKKNLESFDDEPSDAMWERIAPIIPTKPGVNWQGFIMPTSLVVSVVLLVFLGWKIQQYKSTSQSLTEALERSNEQIEQLKNFSTNENLDSILNVAENFNSTENSTENFNSNSNLITDKQKSTTPKNEYNYINSSKIKKKITGENNDNNNIIGNQKLEIINGNIPNLSTITKEKIEVLPFKIENFIPNFVPNDVLINNVNIESEPLAILQLKPIFLPILRNISGVDIPIKEEKVKTTQSQSITLFVAPTVLKNNIRPSKGSSNFPSRPQQNEVTKIGKSIGLKYNRSLNDKWSLTVVGLFTNSSYDFNSKHSLSYDKNSETDLSTDKVSNNIDYLGSSTYGEYRVGLGITRLRNSAINQNEEIDIEVDATANVKSISIPIYAIYNILNQNKLSVGLKGGMGYNRLISNRLDITDFKINREGIEINDIRLSDSPKATQRNSFNAITGIVLDYQLVNNWSISVEPTWSAALSDNNRGRLGRTKSNTFGLEVGLKYSF
jgi:hypothetical protein